MSRISNEVQTFGEWIKRETKISSVVYNNDSASNSSTISARIVFLSAPKSDSAKRDFRDIEILLRIVSPANLWRDCLNTVQDIMNNLLREREHDIRFDTPENTLGPDSKEGDFIIDLPVTLIASTGASA